MCVSRGSSSCGVYRSVSCQAMFSMCIYHRRAELRMNRVIRICFLWHIVGETYLYLLYVPSIKVVEIQAE